MAAQMLQKYQGALVGGIVGDCFGAVFEFLSFDCVLRGKVQKFVKKIEDDHKRNVVENERFVEKKVYVYTDDSAMARSVAKSLIKNKGVDVTDMAKRFTKEYFKESNRGYGACVPKVFHTLADSGYSDLFGPARAQFDGKGSFGNGGAMRISPAGLFAQTNNLEFDELRGLVEQITLLTHTHILAIHGAILQCYAVQLALRTTTIDVHIFLQELVNKMQILEEKVEQEKRKCRKETSENDGKKEIDPDSSVQQNVGGEGQEGDVPHPYCHKLEMIRDFLTREHPPDMKEVITELGVYIAALDSVPVAIYCFLRGIDDIEGLEDRNPFERTIIYAISLGGDTDTVATMAGAIAGAYHGINLIPEAWHNCCEGRDRAMKDAEQLFNLKSNEGCVIL